MAELQKRTDTILNLTIDNRDVISLNIESTLPCTNKFIEELNKEIGFKVTKIHIPSLGIANFKNTE